MNWATMGKTTKHRETTWVSYTEFWYYSYSDSPGLMLCDVPNGIRRIFSPAFVSSWSPRKCLAAADQDLPPSIAPTCDLLMSSGTLVNLISLSCPRYNLSSDSRRKISFGKMLNWFSDRLRHFKFVSSFTSTGIQTQSLRRYIMSIKQ